MAKKKTKATEESDSMKYYPSVEELVLKKVKSFRTANTSVNSVIDEQGHVFILTDDKDITSFDYDSGWYLVPTTALEKVYDWDKEIDDLLGGYENVKRNIRLALWRNGLFHKEDLERNTNRNNLLYGAFPYKL